VGDGGDEGSREVGCSRSDGEGGMWVKRWAWENEVVLWWVVCELGGMEGTCSLRFRVERGVLRAE